MERLTAGGHATVSLVDHLLVVRFHTAPDTVDTVADIVAVVAQVEAGGRHPILWDVRRWPSGHPATWMRLVSTVGQLFTAAALLHKPSSRPIIEEGATTRRSTVPFGMFSSEADAQAFLRARVQPTGEIDSEVPGVVETSVTVVWFEDGIVFVRDKGIGPATVDGAAECLAVIGQVAGSRPRPILWDARGWRGFGPEVWILVVSAVESLATGVAMVVDPESSPSDAFPEAISRFMVPYRVFTDRDAALAFLRSLEPPG